MKKIILDLCGGTGAWSLPYKEAGYDVRNITLPDYDVRKYLISRDNISFDGKEWIAFEDIYGILSAPPCTMFSFARTNAKNPRDLKSGMEIVNACLDIIHTLQYRLKSDQQKYPPLKFWALENPYYAMTKWFLGKPAFVFDPWEFGHNYKKKTALWGHFIEPTKTVKVITEGMLKEDLKLSKTNSRKLPKFDMLTIQAIRAITPRGFAEAFFKANP